MRLSTITARSKINFSRIRLGESYKLLEGVGWNRRMNDNHILNGCHQSKRGKVFKNIKRQLGVEMRIDRKVPGTYWVRTG